MSKIITEPSQVNNYLLTKGKSDRQAEQKAAEGAAKRFERERIEAMNPEDIAFKNRDMELAQLIGHELVSYYPGHGWQVECDIRNGVAKIFNCHMSGLYGYLLHLNKLNLDTFRVDIMRVGGELLESFGLSRGKFDEAEVVGIQRDRTGAAKVKR